MKRLKKLAALVLTGAMALTLLAGCGGNSGSSNSDKIELVNTMLQAHENDITVVENSTLTKEAESWVSMMKQLKEVPTSVADDPENEEYAEIREQNGEIEGEKNVKRLDLYNRKILVYTFGQEEFSEYANTNDASCANDLAYAISNLQEGWEEDGEYRTETYWPGEGYDSDVDIGLVKVTGIGIAKVTDMPLNTYADSCAGYCYPEKHVSGNEEDYYEDNYLAHTQKFTGWVVMISYE